MAAQPERFYREVVRSGYRAPHFIGSREIVATGDVDLEGLGEATREEMSDDEVERQLLALPGIGPYAAAHVMMTLGRNSKLILDSWTRPNYRRLAGARAPTDRRADRAAVQALRARGGPRVLAGRDARLGELNLPDPGVAPPCPTRPYCPGPMRPNPPPLGARPEDDAMKECRWRLVAPSRAAQDG